MAPAEYRIESSHPIASLFLAEPGSQHYVRDRALAIVVAATPGGAATAQLPASAPQSIR